MVKIKALSNIHSIEQLMLINYLWFLINKFDINIIFIIFLNFEQERMIIKFK